MVVLGTVQSHGQGSKAGTPGPGRSGVSTRRQLRRGNAKTPLPFRIVLSWARWRLPEALPCEGHSRVRVFKIPLSISDAVNINSCNSRTQHLVHLLSPHRVVAPERS